MNKKQATFALLFSVFTAGTSFGTVAHAATQSQSQVVLSQQEQDVDTVGGSNVNQNQTSSLAATDVQATTKQSPDQQVDNTTSSVGYAEQGHTENGAGQFSQTQNQNAVNTLSKSNTDKSNQTQTQTTVNSAQSGTIQTSGSTTFSQSAFDTIQNSESQTAESQPVIISSQVVAENASPGTNSKSGDSGRNVTYANELVTTPGHTYHTSFQPTPASSMVVGYAVFDLNGDRLSDTYGSYSNKDNNKTGNYDAFSANTPTLVFIRPVNADGEPVVSQSSANLYLSTTNANGEFLSLDQYQTFDSIELPTGSTGATVLYVNHGSAPQFDVLNVSTVDPDHHHDRDNQTNNQTQRPQSLGAETDQSQNAKIADTTATQSQTVVALSNQTQQNSSSANQSQSSSQSADSSQNQNVTTADGSKVGQNESASIGTGQTSSSDNTHDQSLNVTASQHEDASSTESSAQPTTLSQSQSVTIQSPIISVTLSQTHTSSSLDESITASTSQGSNQQGSTVVNVQIGDKQQQLTLGTDGPVTVHESQSINTGDDSSYTHNVSVDYSIGSEIHSVPIA